MIGRVKECFKESQGKLKSPDGTILDFELLNNTNANNVTKMPVSIMKKSVRSNSAEWAGELDCGTILHEVLHFMGLCDGYQEKDTVKKYMMEKLEGIIDFSKPGVQQLNFRNNDLLYDCRSLAPETNIMSISRLPEDSYQLVSCLDTARVGNPIRQKQKCPKDLVRTSVISKSRLDSTTKHSPKTKDLFISTTKIEGEALLSNAQMRLITLPHCHEKNNLYIMCSQNAYRTSVLEECLGMPIECRNGDYLK